MKFGAFSVTKWMSNLVTFCFVWYGILMLNIEKIGLVWFDFVLCGIVFGYCLDLLSCKISNFYVTNCLIYGSWYERTLWWGGWEVGRVYVCKAIIQNQLSLAKWCLSQNWWVTKKDFESKPWAFRVFVNNIYMVYYRTKYSTYWLVILFYYSVININVAHYW